MDEVFGIAMKLDFFCETLKQKLNAGVFKQPFPSAWVELPPGTNHDLPAAEAGWGQAGKTSAPVKYLRNVIMFTGQISLNVIADPPAVKLDSCDSVTRMKFRLML